TQRLFEIAALLAAVRAQLGEGGKLLLGLIEIASLDIKLPKIFARGLEVRPKVQRLVVVGERGRIVAGLAKREAEKIVDIGFLIVFGEAAQPLDGGSIVASLNLGPGRCQVDGAGRRVVIDRERGAE